MQALQAAPLHHVLHVLASHVQFKSGKRRANGQDEFQDTLQSGDLCPTEDTAATGAAGKPQKLLPNARPCGDCQDSSELVAEG